MKTQIIEAHGNGGNFGKFMVCQLDTDEWERKSVVDPDGRSLLASIGYWHRDWFWLLDLQTGEGVFVQPKGRASWQLDKHKVWVCPLFEPFMDWFISQEPTDVAELPIEVLLPDAPGALYGYRRAGHSCEDSERSCREETSSARAEET
jgi:hypothetical protein